MQLNFSEYRDRVYACWLGKNIGGTMGTPYEGKRELLDIQGFASEPIQVGGHEGEQRTSHGQSNAFR